MLRSETERNASAQRIAKHIRLLIAERLDDDGQVIAHVARIDLTIRKRRPSMAMQINRNYKPMLRKNGQHRLEHFYRAQSAMKQKQWLTFAIEFVVIINAIR
jgi:hypothetical protein